MAWGDERRGHRALAAAWSLRTITCTTLDEPHFPRSCALPGLLPLAPSPPRPLRKGPAFSPPAELGTLDRVLFFPRRQKIPA